MVVKIGGGLERTAKRKIEMGPERIGNVVKHAVAYGSTQLHEDTTRI